MDALTIALILVGALFACVGGLVLLVRAFQESAWWGVACLFVPFATLVFTACHWARAKGSFICSMIGTVMIIGGVMKSGVGFSEQSLVAALTGGTAGSGSDQAEDLTYSIQQKRTRIESLEGQFAVLGADLTKRFQALEQQRKALKTDDAAGVQRFNFEAQTYQAQNTTHKTIAAELETERKALQGLLDERAQLGARAATTSASSKSVVMYTTSSCPACIAAKSYFARKGVSYDERNVEQSPAALQEFRSLGGRGVPLIMVGSERMDGFSSQRLDQLL